MTYTTADGDNWDAIAKKVYGDELKADALIAANLRYVDVFSFDSGVVLTAPELTDEQAVNLPPWRR